jgi:hypothetical protein
MSLELLLFQDIQDCQPHSTGYRAATKLSQGTMGMSDTQQNGPYSIHQIATHYKGSDRNTGPKPQS